jgi:hypothetical protein
MADQGELTGEGKEGEERRGAGAGGTGGYRGGGRGCHGVLLGEGSLALCCALLCCLREEENECSCSCACEGKRRERKGRKPREKGKRKKWESFSNPEILGEKKNNRQFTKLVSKYFCKRKK